MYAANLLQSNLKNVLGHTLPISHTANEGNGISVSLGDTEMYQENVGERLSNLNEDGFVIRRVGKNIYINGENEYALINGINYFSEKYLGVKHLTIDCTSILNQYLENN